MLLCVQQCLNLQKLYVGVLDYPNYHNILVDQYFWAMTTYIASYVFLVLFVCLVVGWLFCESQRGNKRVYKQQNASRRVRYGHKTDTCSSNSQNIDV